MDTAYIDLEIPDAGQLLSNESSRENIKKRGTTLGSVKQVATKWDKVFSLKGIDQEEEQKEVKKKSYSSSAIESDNSDDSKHKPT